MHPATAAFSRPTTSRFPLKSPAPERSPLIVAIGGGTGLPAVLEGLCRYAADHDEDQGDHPTLTAVVTMTDDGGSSGRLRREAGILPPGDVRNCLGAMARTDSPLRELLQHRFTNAGALDGHAVGNLLLTALTQMTGDFVEAVDRLGEIIGLRGRVLPTSSENVQLSAELESGEIVAGETAIVGRRQRIRRLWLEPSPKPVPEVLRALVNADAVVVGPGSLYTSILPNLLVEGVASTLSGVNAIRIYVANLMTEPGETDDYSLDDHLEAVRTHTGFDLFDYILVNRGPISPDAAARYAAQGSKPVGWTEPLRWAGRAKVVDWDLAPECSARKIRHDPASLARAIRNLARAGRPSVLAEARHLR